MIDMKINNCAIIGMGALGLLYASKIAENIGQDAVSFVVDEGRFSRYKGRHFVINDKPVSFNIVCEKDAKPYDLVIVAVKYPSLKGALDTMQNCIGENTTIISVMNGVTSEKIIGARFGDEKLLYAIAQGMDAMHFGDSLKYTSYGQVLIGTDDPQKAERLNALDDFLSRADIPHEIPADILHALWGKFLLNVGVNQVCMVYNTNYGGVLAEGEPNRMMIAAMREVIAVAASQGVTLTEKDLNFYVGLERVLPPESMPSMAQDRLERRPCEVDMFAGTVTELAKEHDILVPANAYLLKRAKEIEAEY